MITPKAPRPYMRKKAEKAGLLLAKGLTFQQAAKKVKSSPKLLKSWAAFFNWQIPAKAEPGYKKKQLAVQKKQERKEQERQAVKQLLEAGNTHQTIRADLNLSYAVFKSHLKQLGSVSKKNDDYKRKAEACRLYELHEKEPEVIEQELGLQPGIVKKWASKGKWNNGKPTFQDLRYKAQCMYEFKGLQIDEIAEQVIVPQSTLNKWKSRDKWRIVFEDEKQKLAAELTNKFTPLIEIAEQCQVSLKTIAKWAKLKGWAALIEETAQQQQARQLFTTGMQQKDIAISCGVSEKSICNWKKQFKWQMPFSETAQQQQARQLFTMGMQQKDIAISCGVSEKTICNWKKQMKWTKIEVP